MSILDFDHLAQRATATDATLADKDALFRAVFALETWHFIGRGSFPNIHPFVAVGPQGAGGRPMLAAFTDTDRLTRYARATGLAGPDGNVNMLAIPGRRRAERAEAASRER